ncbi:endonuclease/exonuclease/phosphatase family protein [Nocardioides sp. 616]|uniref:endonuclease/exonuclease/phosphatase family protein n=1 Tax=Nocardioides sp. 616 TaxID=2268090 RepID=UPI001F058EE8|nr:endonuclease/exonuclease/phosphatase family protein [Nocardioides sp. 616]
MPLPVEGTHSAPCLRSCSGPSHEAEPTNVLFRNSWALFRYWDYYRQRFERNRGLRIDFILGSPSLAARVSNAFIDREERAGTGASDHAPVIADLSG